MNALEWEELIPLREKNVDEYVPSNQQIIEYAEYIGLQFPQDQHLLYIAKEGITANLPEEWEACQTIHGDMVYRNTLTKQIQEEHPLDLLYRNKVSQIKNQTLHGFSDIEFDLNQSRQLLPSIEQQKNQLSESNHSDEMEKIGKAVDLKIVNKNKSERNQSTFFHQYKSILNQADKKEQGQNNSVNRLETISLSLSKNLQSSNKSQYQSGIQQSKFYSKQIPIPIRNKIPSDQLENEDKCSYESNEKVINGQIQVTSFKEKEKYKQTQKYQYKQKRISNQKVKIKDLQSELSNFQRQKQLKLNLLHQIQSNNQLKTMLIRTKIKSLHNNFSKQKKNSKLKLQHIIIQN